MSVRIDDVDGSLGLKEVEFDLIETSISGDDREADIALLNRLVHLTDLEDLMYGGNCLLRTR